MSESGLINVEKQERRPWKKCVWKSYRLDTGKHLLGEGMQGTAVLIVTKGSIRFMTHLGEGSFLLRAQEVCMISTPPPYSVVVEEEAHLLACLFHSDIFPFDRDMLGALLKFYKGRKACDYVAIKANETIFAFAGLMDDYMQRGFGSDPLFEVKRQELFLLLFASCSKEELAAFFYSLVGGEGLQFKEFVSNNYLKAKNVKHLAQMDNLSTSGFIKKFKRYFNESPYQWMLRQKASAILDEINSSQTSLKEIAYKYNFSTYQHFVEFCKMRFGVAPSRLRGSWKV